MRKYILIISSIFLTGCNSLDELFGFYISLENLTDYEITVETRIRYPQQLLADKYEEGTGNPNSTIRLKDPPDDYEGDFTVKVTKARYKDNPAVILLHQKTIKLRHDEVPDAMFVFEGNAVDGFKLSVKE